MNPLFHLSPLKRMLDQGESSDSLQRPLCPDLRPRLLADLSDSGESSDSSSSSSSAAPSPIRDRGAGRPRQFSVQSQSTVTFNDRLGLLLPMNDGFSTPRQILGRKPATTSKFFEAESESDEFSFTSTPPSSAVSTPSPGRKRKAQKQKTPESTNWLLEPSTPSPGRKRKAQKQQTPEGLRKLKAELENGEYDLETSLLPDQRFCLQNGVKSLQNVGDTPVKKRRATKVANFAESVLKQGLPGSEGRSVYQRIDESPWAKSFLGDLNQVYSRCKNSAGVIMPRSFNMEHITSVHNGKGWHFCPQGDPNSSCLRDISRNKVTGVFIAFFGNKRKESSFFPPEIQTPEALEAVMHGSEVICREKNKILCKMEFRGSKFYGIKYLRAGGILVHSCFPIFYLDDLNSYMDIFELPTEDGIPKRFIMDGLRKMILEGHLQKLTEFEHSGRLLLNLSTLLDINNIKKGFYFWINKSSIQDDIDQATKLAEEAFMRSARRVRVPTDEEKSFSSP